MNYVCIMSVEGNSVTKVQYAETEADAQQQVSDHPEYPDAYYVITPSFPEWRWVCDPVAKTITDRGPLTQGEEDAKTDAKKEKQMSRIFGSEEKVDKILKAFALTVLDEVNLLRAEHSLPPRTAQQLRDAVKAKL